MREGYRRERGTGAMATPEGVPLHQPVFILPPVAALLGRRGVGPQLSTPQATAAAMGACHPAQGLRECGCAAPLRSGGWVFSPPPGAVASGSGWRGGLPAAAVAVVASGLEYVAAGLLESFEVAIRGWMPGSGRGSALPFLSPGAHPASLDWCHPAGRMAGISCPVFCCQVPQSRLTTSA
jgi:hypothetical protein